MPEFGKRIDQPGGRRRARRKRVVLAGASVAEESLQHVIIEDLCSTGAKLRGRNLPVSGKNMRIAVGSMTLNAAVAWNGSEQCGVTFDTPLDEMAVRQLLHEGRWGHVLSII